MPAGRAAEGEGGRRRLRVRRAPAECEDRRVTAEPDQELPAHVLRELGFDVRRDGDGLTGTATVTPELHVPGTDRLRTSVLAAWADTVCGLLAVEAVRPAVPVTVELDVHLSEPVPATATVQVVGRTVKRGRSVFVAEVELRADGRPLGVGGGSFMTSRDRSVRLPPRLSPELPATGPRLTVPLAERARCERPEPGMAVLPRSEDGLNSSRTINGGLIALAAEEAVLGLVPGATLCSMAVRYLQPARLGPLVATARVDHGLGLVELHDEGAGHRLSAVATVRTFP